MKYLLLIATVAVLSSCIKDKLENESSILVGTWTWDHSIEYTYDSANDTVIGTVVPASNYPDVYSVTFLQKGKISTLRNGMDQEQYRVILDEFKSGTCDLTSGYEYKIKLDNKDNDTLVGCVNSDTLTMSDFHMPLSKGSSAFPYYQHVFLKH